MGKWHIDPKPELSHKIPEYLKTVYICSRCGARYKRHKKKCPRCQGSLQKKTIVEDPAQK